MTWWLISLLWSNDFQGRCKRGGVEESTPLLLEDNVFIFGRISDEISSVFESGWVWHPYPHKTCYQYLFDLWMRMEYLKKDIFQLKNCALKVRANRIHTRMTKLWFTRDKLRIKNSVFQNIYMYNLLFRN